MYTMTAIANFLGVPYDYASHLFERNDLRPIATQGKGNLKHLYSVYQIDLVKQQMEYYAQNAIHVHLETKEVFMIVESKMNLG
jgi:hypothetical protein